MKQLKDLKQEFLENKFNNFYVFYGEDYGLRKHYIERLKQNYKKVIVTDDYLNFSQNKGNSLFDIRTLYIFYNCEQFLKSSKSQIEVFLKKIGNDCVVYDSDVEYPNSTVFKEFSDYVTYFPIVSDNIALQFVQSNIDLILPSSESIAYNCYNNYAEICLETSKIKNYAEEKQISQQQAFEVLKANNQLNIRYDEYNSDLINNDILCYNTNSFSYWDNLIKTLYPEQFWINLTKLFNDFLIAHYLMKYGKWDGGTKAYNLGFSWYRIKIIREFIHDAYRRRFGPTYRNDFLYYAYELSKFDYDMKTGTLKPEDMFNYLVYCIM